MSNLILGEIDITPLLDAKKNLDAGISSASSDLEKTGAIKAFEFCFELSWKAMKRILAKKGLQVTSPRDAFRVAADNELIKDPETWFKFIDKRNLTVHTYDKKIAEEVLKFLPTFQQELNEFIKTITKL